MGIETTVSDIKVDLLKHEMEILNQKINHFDGLRHRTKQMALTLSVAILGVGLKFGIGDVNLRWILPIGIFVPFIFWALESFYHAYQEGFIKRFWAITSFIRDGEYRVRDEDPPVSLTECLNDHSFGGFPVPDYYALQTLSQHKHSQITSVWRNFLKIKMVVFYTPIMALGGLSILRVWKLVNNTIFAIIAIVIASLYLGALAYAMFSRKTPE